MKPIGILIAFIICGLATAGLAQDKERLIWGGGDPATSVYSSAYVPRIIDVLTQNRLSSYQWGGPSKGTLDNAQKVTENPTNLAVGQWDILRDLNGKPIPGTNETYSFHVLAQNLGPECLYMVTDQPGYSTFGHVLGNSFDITLATNGPGSGSLATWEHLQSLFSELNDVTVKQVDGGALGVIQAVTDSPDVTHGFFVMRPDPNSDTFKVIHDKKLTLVPVVDKLLEDEYTFADQKVAYAGFIFGADQRFTTACTSVALITGDPNAVPADNTKARRRLEAVIDRIGSPSMAEQLKPDLSTWRDMWDNFKIAGAEQVAGLIAASEQAIKDATSGK